MEDDGSPPASLLAYFEPDQGNKGVQELVRKARRHPKIPNTLGVGFIFQREMDMQLTRKTIGYSFISYATLDQFTLLREEAFYSADGAPAGDI